MATSLESKPSWHLGTITSTLVLVSLFVILGLFSFGDIIMDLSEGESASHVLTEGSLLLVLFGSAIYFSRAALLHKKTARQTNRRISLLLALGSSLGLICATVDDAPFIVSGTAEASKYVGSIALSHNLHEVVPGKIYRSGEMSHENFGKVLSENHIKTVVDLRFGEDDSDPRGQTERDVAAGQNVRYEHIRLLSSKVPPLERINALFAVFDRAELPMLIHCSGGAHRTGFAAALWLMEKEGQSKETALAQLSPRYGFFRWERQFKSHWRGEPTLDSLIWRYAEESDGVMSFREWIQTALQDQTDR